MKKIVSIFLAAMMVLSLAACGSKSKDANSGSDSKEAKTITITALNGNAEPVELTVPYDPQRVAILDFAALDILDNLGLGDRVVGSASTTLDYLKKYTEKSSVKKLGTIKEADLEAVMSCEPDIIFIGGRLSKFYDALSEIAPVVYLATDSELGVVESTRKIADTIASIFGKEEEMKEKFNGFDDRIAALKEVSNGKTAVIGMCTSGSFNVLGDDGRCALIGNEVGFQNLCNNTSSERSGNGGEGKSESSEEKKDSSGEERQGGSSEGGSTPAHGNEASFELVVSLKPDYIFVMDRDAAIGTNGATLAQDIMENELIKGTDAYKNGNLVYLANPAVWYTAEGGVTALDTMISDLESALLKK